MPETPEAALPLTEAGRAAQVMLPHFDHCAGMRGPNACDCGVVEHIVAIEAEAVRGAGLDVERLVRAMEDVFPGWLEEAPGTADAQAEMRAYAEQLDKAYRWLADSASPPLAAPRAALASHSLATEE